MDFESREIIEKILELTEENNKILRKMRRSIMWGRIFHILYWILIIGVSVGAYAIIQPYFDSSLKFFEATKDGLTNLDKVTELLKSFPK